MLDELLESMFDAENDSKYYTIAGILGNEGFCEKKVTIQKGMLSFYTKEFSVDQEIEGKHFQARSYGHAVILSWVTSQNEVTGMCIHEKEIDRVSRKVIKVKGKDAYIINTKRSDYCIIKQE
ncbi:hypothetical protein CON65_16315 [Bacillus pseudomycoides]|uniref:Uncharacterized protein n=1 Tax=Bacillus pseudomycoides TaxID=64104 RepID=A0AA91VAG2_9BACI|nr:MULTISPECIES: hypothetical protein [Bacillus]PEB48619.1 hypothetical protein COO03_24090 [Bacillus sp. AFS098217]PED81572.1 hypothetical protein CON65_16315 [Bacillus pseudomycoides]PEU15570.1 hypothetical protein CN525_16730 [Bacillus sp. AFS014408]PEU16388.1 hypothetical protein CN524_04830 [Bacillus sp. AFS019443]PFW65139.1 hypothetical protein COL20_01400 [Bacillus sp. AFS075034]